MPIIAPQPSLKQLKYFVAVAQNLNFRRASHLLHISQPTLTNQIMKLEEGLGLTLFERSRNGTMLSPEGRELLKHAEHLLQTMTEFQNVARELSQGPKTTFKLGIPPTLGPYLLPFVLPQLHQLYDKLKFYVRESAPSELYTGLYKGDYDLIISPFSSLPDDFVTEPLFTEPLKLVLSSEHPMSKDLLIEPRHLKGQTILTLEDKHHFHHQVLDICNELGAVLQQDYEGTSLDTLRQMVVMGMGAAFLPGLYVHSEMHVPESLHVCEIKDKPILRQHALAWRNTSPSRVFFRELADRFRRIIKARLSHVVEVHTP
ncbi:LysR substrate-binding domain-containing protein [uncultured Paraglaciecola sp.]|uniref:hydrogen peroxide-inducible genes activator n=1 Tax=uncultured Paraglaciecola sp. TaxID=1765024 RepID=UPI0030D955E4|tara:strand:+ start:16352 stop:17296 length:945 start_codon:yes stop_codon:yes gene_type:complete